MAGAAACKPGAPLRHLDAFMSGAGLIRVCQGTLAIRMQSADFADYWEPSSRAASSVRHIAHFRPGAGFGPAQGAFGLPGRGRGWAAQLESPRHGRRPGRLERSGSS